MAGYVWRRGKPRPQTPPDTPDPILGKVLKPCGTYAAWRRHKSKDEPIDDACQMAYDQYQKDHVARRAIRRKERREAQRA